MHVGIVDFFCGCGGTSTGFRQAADKNVHVDIVAGVDIDPHSCATFQRSVGAPAYRLDIRALRPSDLHRLAVEWKLASFDKVVVLGCAPCQGFAAHRKAMEDDDPRRSLFVVFTDIVNELSPDAIFMENVPDLFSKQHWPYFVKGRKNLEAAGFNVAASVFNFAEFGLPQERFRAVMMAMKQPFALPEPDLTPSDFRTVRDAIGDLPPLSSGETDGRDPMHVVSKHRPETLAVLRQVPKDGGNRPLGVGPACLDRARAAHGGYTDVYGRLAWGRPAVTITARCRTPSCGRFIHPDQDRGLSVREAALLQGFPPDFVFEGPFDDKYKQIGNAVPPLVAERFARHIFAELRRPSRTAHAGVGIDGPVGAGFAVTINGIKRRRERNTGLRSAAEISA